MKSCIREAETGFKPMTVEVTLDTPEQVRAFATLLQNNTGGSAKDTTRREARKALGIARLDALAEDLRRRVAAYRDC